MWLCIPGHGVFPHFWISTGRPTHCTVAEVLTQVLLLILRPPPQVTEHDPQGPHGLHLATKRHNRREFQWIILSNGLLTPLCCTIGFLKDLAAFRTLLKQLQSIRLLWRRLPETTQQQVANGRLESLYKTKGFNWTVSLILITAFIRMRNTIFYSKAYWMV